MNYPTSERQEALLARARALALVFAERAPAHDRAGSFPHENFADLRQAGFAGLTVPRAWGGEEATLLETVLIVEALGVGDGSTALSYTMHAQSIGSAVEGGEWPPALLEALCRDAVERGALVNAVASEPELGSPSRGGRPRTTARPLLGAGGAVESWIIDGRKSWASMSPTLDYLIVSAALEDGSESVARFLVPMGDGIEIVETWDALGMRSTGSHDVLLRGVTVPSANLIERERQATVKGAPVNAWFMLGVSAVYLGVAHAAIEAAARFARERIPTALGKPIAEVESIQRQIGQAAFLVGQARLALYHVADLWDRLPERRPSLGALVSVAKVTATNNAIVAVDHCMRVAGGSSMSRALPLERYYRDVRGGLNHPINDDAAYVMLGREALRKGRGGEHVEKVSAEASPS